MSTAGYKQIISFSCRQEPLCKKIKIFNNLNITKMAQYKPTEKQCIQRHHKLTSVNVITHDNYI